MKKKAVILVTGVGGNIGQGIVKAARLSGLVSKIVGTDMESLSSGFYSCDVGYAVKGAHQKGFLNQIVRIIKKEGVQLVFVGSDLEVPFFAKHRKEIEKKTKAMVIVSRAEAVRVGHDKWDMFRFCTKEGIRTPDSCLPSSSARISSFVKKWGFPLIIKPRVGYGSRGVYKVDNRKELNVLLKRVKNPILQEFLPGEKSEYTSSTFVLEDNQLKGTILFRRILSSGATYKSEVVYDRKLIKQVEDVVKRIKPLGPCNLQFRVKRGKIYPFEFNVRYSGTTPIRAALGYNDVAMAIQAFLFNKPIRTVKVRSGVAFRYWNELMVFNADFSSLSRSARKTKKSFKSQVLSAF